MKRCSMFLFLSILLAIQPHISHGKLSIWYTDQQNEILSKILEGTFGNCTKLFVNLRKFKLNLIATDAGLSVEIAMSKNRGNFIWSVTSNQDNGFSKNTTIFTNKLTKVKDLHQKRCTCAIAVFILDFQTTEDAVNSFVNAIINVVQKDRDYFLFIAQSKPTENEDLLFFNKFLLNAEIAQGIRNKLLMIIPKTQQYNETVHLLTSCPFCKNGHSSIINITVPSFRKLSLSKLFPNFLLNFYGKVFRMSSASETKWLNEIRPDKSNPGKWIAIRGVYVMVTMELSHRLNFTCEFFPSVGGGGTGYKYPNGTWIGTVADVFYGNSELGQVGGQTKGRYEAVDFTFPISYEWLTFTTGEPTPFYSWHGIYRPLSLDSWAMTCLACGITLLAFFLISNCHSNLENGKEPARRLNTSTRKYMNTSVGFIVKALIEQSSENVFTPRVSTWFRILCLFWLIFCLIVTTAYKSKLVSFIAFPNVISPPSTLEELANSNYKIILQYTGAAYQLYKTSKSPTYIKIVDKMAIEKSDVKCLKMALHSKAACLSWENIVDYVGHKNLSDSRGRLPLIKAVNARAYFLLGGIMMRKRTIFKEEFDLYIKLSMDSGLMIKWKKFDVEWILRERREWEKETNQSRVDYSPKVRVGLTMGHLKGGFLFWGMGVAVAWVVIVGEMLNRRRSRKQMIMLYPLLSKIVVRSGQSPSNRF